MKKMGNIFSWRSSSSSRTPTTSMAASRSGSAGFGSDSCSRISSAPSTTSFVAAAAAGGSSGSRGYRRSKKNHNFAKWACLILWLLQVTEALRESGLESSNLIIGIDFTKSNEWTGKLSFNKRSLHAIGDTPNPYEKAISIIGKTLAPFDEDNLIPCFGFGDVSTRDQEVFSFHNDHSPCHGFEEVLACYRRITPHLKLSGPTSYAPIVDAAVDIVEGSAGQFHVLVIIADGQVTRSVNTSQVELSPQEEKTINSIVNARISISTLLNKPDFDNRKYNILVLPRTTCFFVSWKQVFLLIQGQSFICLAPFRPHNDRYIGAQYATQSLRFLAISLYPLSIVLVGVGDGPWEEMKKFDDKIPAREFDNFQFVNFTTIMSKNASASEKESAFALAALMEIPIQYQAAKEFGLLGRVTGKAKKIVPRPPPVSYSGSAAFQSQDPSNLSASIPEERNQVCPICLSNGKDLAFGCGHMTCRDCGSRLSNCPICRLPITNRLRLYI
ncbi:hypothetical protein M9H77_15188 [Catharanthus roseus]|uniref:Uncharacterized protein n=1 Tax=Catharanthus roseus TaxID=4058 RepID=A0ACC0BQ62_CATRO|nr:hypothetical protein M9H77_15188 [Catharanthus roseus]